MSFMVGFAKTREEADTRKVHGLLHDVPWQLGNGDECDFFLSLPISHTPL